MDLLDLQEILDPRALVDQKEMLVLKVLRANLVLQVIEEHLVPLV